MAPTENRDLTGSGTGSKPSAFHPLYGTSYAIVVGIDTYLHPRLCPLGNAEEDARSFAEVISTKPYSFQVDLLLGESATREAITEALNRVIKTSQPDDRVIFYFAGHGYIHPDNRGYDTGYLACADTDPDDPFDGLEYDEVKKLTRYAKAKHVAFILDACFSGSALGLTRAVVQPAAAQEYLLHNAYQVLTAGGVEVVADSQSMTDELVKALREGLPGEGPPFTFNRLSQHIQDVIHSRSRGRQTPVYGYLEGSSKGQMVLVTPTPFDTLPEGLRLALTDDNPHIRQFAVDEAVKYLADPELGDKVYLILERMQVEDEDREVRRRAAEALSGGASSAKVGASQEDKKAVPGSEKQPGAQIPDATVEAQVETGGQPPARRKLDWRWIAGITGAVVLVFVLSWMGWKVWGFSPPEGTTTVDPATRTAMIIEAEEQKQQTSTEMERLVWVQTLASEKTSTALAGETEMAETEKAADRTVTSIESTRMARETADASTEATAIAGTSTASYLTKTANAVTDTPSPDSSIPPACTSIGQTWISPIDGMTLVCVPAGEFIMGSELGDDDEKPEHTVYLDAFWIDQTEVTNTMFAQFVEAINYQRLRLK